MKQNKTNAITTDLFSQLKNSIHNAESIDIIVSFLMESGVKLIIDDLKESNKKIRILTSDYLNITQPQALYILKSQLKDQLDLRFYSQTNKSFHPKAYIFHNANDSEIYIGSSNLSKGALTTSIEWNYHFAKSEKPDDFSHFQNTFEDLFKDAIPITDDLLRQYSKSWIKPKFTKVQSDEKYGQEFEPNPVQVEALYSLNQSREEGYDKALIVAATGIGKTYLAAFDVKNYEKILFIAHRQEIIKQAEKSFKNIYPNKSTGFFYNKQKDRDKDILFALVQTIGKSNYLNGKYFKPDNFDYIIIDEFHHAVAKSYKKVLDYFTPKFLLGLTATPERLDNKDVFELCDNNTVYEIRLKEAINKGFLCPFKYYGINDETIDYDEILFKNGKYDEKDLEEKLMINERAELILKHYLKYSSKTAIGFCSSRKHAEYMAEHFTNSNIPAASVYSGEQGEYSKEREDAIAKLKNNELRILFTVDMFNEGVDIPSIDTVLFLRPTQSPTVFLQQLGRGLRKTKNKKYLTILDFIGNYKKADFIPFLLSDQEYDIKTLLNESILEFEYPEDCHIDFDFKLIDIFKNLAIEGVKLDERILLEYESVKSSLNHRPTRLELLKNMDESIINKMDSQNNIFNDFITFLHENNELTKEEEIFFNTEAHEFLKTLETTKMTLSYKIPILLAFYNDGNVKMEITDEDVYKSMHAFYSDEKHGKELLQYKSTKDYKTWTPKQYVQKAKKNPIKNLNKTEKKFFIEKEGFAIALADEIKEYITLESFKNHFKDIIEYRTENHFNEDEK